MKKRSLVLCLAILALLASSGFLWLEHAEAAPTFQGSYNVTFYLGPNRTLGAVQCVKFTKTSVVPGEPLSGTWASTTFPGWEGTWIQEADNIRWSGFTDAGLGTSEQGQIINNNMSTGEFHHFNPPSGSTSTLGSWVAVRRSTPCSSSTAAQSAAPGADPSN